MEFSENEGPVLVLVPAQLIAAMERRIGHLELALHQAHAEAAEDIRFSPEERFRAQEQAKTLTSRLTNVKGEGFVLVGPPTTP